MPTHSRRRVKSQDSPTVMDSGRPGVGGTLPTVVGCGLESILKHIKRIIILHLQFNWIPNLRAALTAHLNVREALLSQFAPGCAESHCAGKAAESSTELTEAKMQAKVKMQTDRKSTKNSNERHQITVNKPKETLSAVKTLE